MKTLFIDEYPSESGGGRLGRHVQHDPRSRAYAVSEDLLPSTYTSAVHRVRIPVLDQGDLGSCTGNAAEAFAGTDPLYDAISTQVTARPTGDPVADEKQAVALYSAATRLDDVRGNYPPTDTGSTGVAVAKAAQKAGLISGYQHAFSLDTALKALAVSPLIIGVNWYEGFDQPDANGHVKISGSVRGGHEFLLYGIDATNGVVLARNSWSTSWGVQGTFSFSFDDLGQLLSEDGDATLFVPVSA
ncbi:C1 family peptidase, partial [Actinacidiphila rubida]